MRVLFGLAAVMCVAGCGGSDDGRMAVSGTVKFKDAPIKDGAIVKFVPDEQQGTEGLVMTTGGGYTLPRANGLKPGKYTVTVSLGDGKTAVNPVNPDEPPEPGGGTNIVSKELIPPEWNRKSTQHVTVTADGPNEFNFDIK
jgi:hypothetical protein